MSSLEKGRFGSYPTRPVGPSKEPLDVKVRVGVGWITIAGAATAPAARATMRRGNECMTRY